MRQGISRLMPYNRHHQWITIITSFLLFLRIGTLAFSPSVWHTSKTRVVATTTTRHPTCLRSDTIDRLEECTLVPLQSIVNTHPSITIDETGNLCLGDDVLVDALTPDLTTELFYPTPTTTTLTRETAEDATTRPLILLDEDGNLRLGDKVLLDGLTNDIWSSSAISLSSIFLHTSYETQSPEHESQLGEIHCRNLLACARQTRYWMGPKVGKTSRDVPFDTQFLLVEVSENGPYVLILPLVDNGFRASLHVDKSNVQVTCAAESGDAAVTCCGMRALYVGVHNDDPFQLLKMGFAQVAKATGTFDVLSNKRLPKSIDTFGWCTWDAFYSKVTPQGVLEGVRKLRDIGVPPRTVIIDDGWQQVTPTPPTERAPDLSTLHYLQQGILDTIAKPVGYFYEKFVRRAPHGSFGNRLWSFLSKTTLKKGLWEYFDSTSDFNRQVSGFEANSKFENTNTTLKGLVTELKDVLGVQTVLAWHALHGTWRGVSPELGKKYDIRVTNVHPQPSELLMRLEPQIEWDPVSLFGAGLLSDPKDLAKFYELLHKPLVDAGVDGVKVSHK
jgi:raffinose synthase